MNCEAVRVDAGITEAIRRAQLGNRVTPLKRKN
ncbi:hypothetical protein SUSAZ_07580 [Sulfolobus acidocaldarius SUSAZ]|nr:hypothetical protein SUSAZ_07580 [Sulfolobus acidocaldarius SUSAZ]